MWYDVAVTECVADVSQMGFLSCDKRSLKKGYELDDVHVLRYKQQSLAVGAAVRIATGVECLPTTIEQV